MSHDTQPHTESDRISRRTLIRTSALAVAGLGGLTLASAPAVAGKKGGCDDPPLSYPRVTTRGHFETNWLGSVSLTDGNSETNYDTAGDPIPGLDDEAPTELLVHAHGWNNDLEGGVCSVGEAGETFGLEGYDHPVIGYTWDADFGWYSATEIAERNGKKLGAFVADYRDENPDTTVRLCCHSLGARVVLEALEYLSTELGETAVATTTLLGGAADNDAPALDGTYGEAIETATGRLDNFWMTDDAVLDWAYSTAEWGTAIGASELDGDAPSNYTDHNVDYVPDHFSHYTPEGCLDEVIETFD